MFPTQSVHLTGVKPYYAVGFPIMWNNLSQCKWLGVRQESAGRVPEAGGWWRGSGCGGEVCLLDKHQAPQDNGAQTTDWALVGQETAEWDSMDSVHLSEFSLEQILLTQFGH